MIVLVTLFGDQEESRRETIDATYHEKIFGVQDLMRKRIFISYHNLASLKMNAYFAIFGMEMSIWWNVLKPFGES